MAFENLTGTYTYRSFLDQPSGSPAEILWEEGELFLRVQPDGTIAGQLRFPADPVAPAKAILDVSGRADPGGDISFSGTGRDRTDLAEFRYSYRGRSGPAWDNASPTQRPTLVGTVVRDADHGTALAGATASFIAVKRDFVEPREIKGVALIPEAIEMLASESHRLRHTIWHTLRRAWRSPGMTPDVRGRLAAKGWDLKDPPLLQSGGLDLSNGAGEDFLYMHRRMVRMLNRVYTDASLTPPASWIALPDGMAPQIAYMDETDPGTGHIRHVIDIGSSGVMVPPAVDLFMEQTGNSEFLLFNKTATGFQLNLGMLANRLRSSAFAATQSLGAYGNLIEFTVHNWMHMRWASVAHDPDTGEPATRPTFDISAKWNRPEYDYLGDFHSSHVNPIFWKLHGWVDGCIDAWFAAHEAINPGEVHSQQVRGLDWFAQGKWVRKPDPFDWPGAGNDGHGGNTADELQALRDVMAILEEALGSPTAMVLPDRPDLPGFAAAILNLELTGI